jgi:hypothetical protein
MDVRSIEDVAPIVEHNGTVPVWYLVSPRETRRCTGYVKIVEAVLREAGAGRF